MVRLLRREDLEAVADFSPDYLHALNASAPSSRPLIKRVQD
jgi:hypothetical protein